MEKHQKYWALAKTSATLLIGFLALNASAQVAPQGTREATQVLQQAEALIQRGNLQGAEVMLRQELNLRPVARGHFLLGFVLLQKYEFAGAETALRAAVEAAPRDAAYRHALAKALLEQGRNRAALAELDQAVALDPRPEYHFARAMCALNTGQLELAGAALRASLELQPQQPETLYQLGKIDLDQGDFAGAIDWLRRSTELNPRHTEATFLLGLAQRHTGDAEAAVVAFERTLAQVPGHVGALFNLGAVLAQLGRADEARAVRERFAELSEKQDQIEFLKAGVRKNPDNLNGRLQLATYLLDTGRSSEAMVELRAARQLSPGNAATYRLLERAFEMLGDDNRAGQASRFAAQLEAKP